MSTTNDGGPAFPRPHNITGNAQPGMSLRDWFAGQALISWVNRHDRSTLDHDDIEECAEIAYLFADVMLAEHEKAQAPAWPEVAK